MPKGHAKGIIAVCDPSAQGRSAPDASVHKDAGGGNEQDLSLIARTPALAPFQIRSFRFQWPSDLLASWAFEMEGVILGWFVLVSTGSVLALAAFGALQFLGTLISPLFGMAGDRIGNRAVLILMRLVYLLVASALMVLFLTDHASAVPVFILATIMGLVRPSDITLRNLLVGETMPTDYLMRAMGVSRTTADSARVVGALSGAALVSALGSGLAYVAVCGVYALSLALTFGVGTRRLHVLGDGDSAVSPLRTLREGFAYVWATPVVRAVMLLAFLVNLVAYPLTGSLLAYVAKDVYGVEQTGLGWLIACFAGGALAGSIMVSLYGAHIRAGRVMVVNTLAWLVFNLVFSLVTVPLMGEVVLFLAGFFQSFCMIPMAVILLRVTGPAFRGRVMGVRMLAVYGMPVGLVLAGPAIEWTGFAVTGAAYSLIGLFFTLLIALRWRTELLDRASPSNLR